MGTWTVRVDVIDTGVWWIPIPGESGKAGDFLSLPPREELAGRAHRVSGNSVDHAYHLVFVRFRFVPAAEEGIGDNADGNYRYDQD